MEVDFNNGLNEQDRKSGTDYSSSQYWPVGVKLWLYEDAIELWIL